MRGFQALATNGKIMASAPQAIGSAPGDEQGIRGHDLMVEMMGLVPTFGGRKVTVGFHGDGAFCSFTHGYVNLPALPKASVLPLKIAREIRGFGAHESAHLLFTDEEAKERVMTDAEKKDPLFHQVWNCIEDYMIERNWLILYPGAHKNFSATEDRCCAGYMESYRKSPDMAKDMRITGPVALTWMRALYFGLTTPASADCLATMPASLQQRVRDWFDLIVDVNDTEECIAKARVIHADILANPFDPNDPPANPNHNPLQGQPGQGQPGQGNGQGNGQGQAGNGQAGNGQAGSGTGGNGAGKTGLTAGQGNPTPYTTHASLTQALDEIGGRDQIPGYTSFEVESTAESGPYRDALANPDGMADYRQAQAEVSSTAGTIANIIRRALKARTRTRWKGGRTDGLLDCGRVAEVVLGQIDVYKKRTKAEEIDTAVSIVIDCSGSMGNVLQICKQLAVVLNSAFTGTPITYEIIGYTSGENVPESAAALVESLKEHLVATGLDPNDAASQASGAVRSVEIYEFKPFQGSSVLASTTIGNMHRVPMGGTPTGDAVLIAHQRLGKRKERRHVMFVLTDGQPDDPESCAKAVRSIEACGVTVVALGIRNKAVKKSFQNWALINEPADLSAALVNKLTAILFGDRSLKARAPAKQQSRIVRA